MSDQLPTAEQALRFVRESGCSDNVIKHVTAVAALAVEIARACNERGYIVDVRLVETGALLHDIGRAKTHSVHHAVLGAEMAKSLGLPEPVISIIKRHVGGGITGAEARRLGWPRDVYVPLTLEEKIVSYADKLIEGSRRVPIEVTIEELSNELPEASIQRLWKLHREMLTLVGDCACLP